MKMWKKCLTVLLAAMLVLGLSVTTAMADETAPTEKESYTYTLTVYAGNQGTFNDTESVNIRTSDSSKLSVERSADKIVIRGLHLGDEVSIDAQKAVDLDASSKYYVKGIRQSGRDNSTVAASVFVVGGDADYVVAYGIKGNQVSYTVKYQDEKGKQLAPDQVYYGNVGDKPVVAYKYISGYAPKSLGLTKTLSENEAENVFIFVYTPVPTNTYNEIINEVIVEIIVGGGARPAPSGGSGSGNTSGNTETDEEETQETTTDESQSQEDPTQGGSEQESESESETSGIIVDLDDPEVPLAPGLQANSEAILYGALGVAAVAALIVTLYLLFVAKKSDKKTEE